MLRFNQLQGRANAYFLNRAWLLLLVGHPNLPGQTLVLVALNLALWVTLGAWHLEGS